MRPWFRPLIGVVLALGFAAPAGVASAATAVNHPPAVATNLELDGSACNGAKLGAGPMEPELSFAATDPDGDAVSAKVEYWGTGIASYAHRKSLTMTDPTLGRFSGDLPLPMKNGMATTGTKDGRGSYGLRVLTRDSHGMAAEAWATCNFTVDVKAPSAPKLTGPKLAGPWQLDATHTVLATATGDVSDTAKFSWSLDSDAAPTAGPDIAAVGKSHQLAIPVTPTSYGPHTLYVWAYDPTGNMSEEAEYQFDVEAVNAQFWEYSFDDASGASVPDGGTASAKAPMTLSNPALLQLRGRWVNSTLVTESDKMLDVGQGQAGRGTASMSLAASGSFTVAAALDPVTDAKSPRAMTAVAYGDSTTPWVKLGIDKAGHYALSVYDATSKSYHTVTTATVDDGSLGFHTVVGSYNAVTKRLDISVATSFSTWDAVTQSSKAAATTLPATFAKGHLEVGDGSWKASAAEDWIGRIDHVDLLTEAADTHVRSVLLAKDQGREYTCGVVDGKAPCA